MKKSSRSSVIFKKIVVICHLCDTFLLYTSHFVSQK